MPEEEKNKVLELFDPENKTILDVGCGDGRYSEIFVNTCKKYVGIDINEEQIKENIKNNKYKNAEYYLENIATYKSKEKFDVIVLSIALHEIDVKEQGLALKNMLSILKDDGKIIVLDPNFEKDSFQSLWNVAYRGLKLFDHDYVVKHSQRVIEMAVEQGLCKVTKRDTVYIPFSFNDLDEIYDMIINDIEFRDLNLTEKEKQTLFDHVKKFINKTNDIVIYDKLDITILEKEK